MLLITANNVDSTTVISTVFNNCEEVVRFLLYTNESKAPRLKRSCGVIIKKVCVLVNRLEQ